MEHVQRIHDIIVANEVTLFFAWAIGAVLGLGLLARIPIFSRILWSFNRSGSTIMTTLGVLGTFIGIFLGLIDFDVARIDESVPQLLEGLKTAFLTSILGMGAAVSLKIFQAFVPVQGALSTSVTPEIIHETLKNIEESADGLRSTIKEGQEELVKEFRGFAQKMTENNSKALIEALEGVIRDFNTQLNEQFGENFKQLNQAVGALLDWQKKYKQYIETTERRIEMATTSLETSEASMKEISAHTERIPTALQGMEDVLTALLDTTKDLQQHLEAVAELKDRAVAAFPIIDENLKTLTNKFALMVEKTLEDGSAAFQSHKEGLETLKNGYEQMLESSSAYRDRFSNAVDDTLTNMQTAIRTAMQTHTQTIEESATGMQKQIKDSWTRTQETVNEQLETLDTSMQKELTRALEIMSGHLASLSEKFVEDYTPLTERLRDVISMAEDRKR